MTESQHPDEAVSMSGGPTPMRFRVLLSGADNSSAFIGSHPSFDKFATWDAMGFRRFGSTWVKPALTLEDPRMPLADWGFVRASIPILSEAALTALHGFIDHVEVLPVDVAGASGNHFLLNVPAINAIDLSESRFAIWQATPGRLKSITRVVFHQDVRDHLFYVRSFPGLYCSNDFRNRATSLRGFACSDVLEVP